MRSALAKASATGVVVMKWTTSFADVVTVGDQVALSLLGHPEAFGRILGEAEHGRPVVECSHCLTAVTVEDFNLSMLIKRGGEQEHAC